MRFCRDLYKKRDGAILFYGGTEEELIKKGEQLCECLSRLLTALCSIVRIPARILTHTIGGHLVCEIFIDGKWAYVDPRRGLYFQLSNNSLASIWELWKDHTILDSQPDSIKLDASDRFAYEDSICSLKYRLLHPDEVITIKYYSLNEASKFNYEWKTNTDLDQNNLNSIAHIYRSLRCEVFDLENIESGYGFDFSLACGQYIEKDIMVFAYPRGFTVAPVYVNFKIDDSLV